MAKAVTVIASKKKRPEIMNEVEKLLLKYIKEKQLASDSINPTMFCKKG